MVPEDAGRGAAGHRASAELEALIALHRRARPEAPVGDLARAYDIAASLHNGQVRTSGDPYLTHPLAVASLLAELGMDTTTLVAALLHDTIEDGRYPLDQLRVDFGDEVAMLVGGVAALDRVMLTGRAKAELIRKMIVALAKDPRVLVIKLADRLHNMRTVAFLPRPKQEQKARETLDVLAPLAKALGLDTIKWQLEDLSFGTLFPARFEELTRLIDERAPQRDAVLRQVIDKVAADLADATIKARVTGRLKPVYSIHQKMTSNGCGFAEIDDLIGVRIMVDTVRDCYAALAVIRDKWQAVPDGFEDYIATPRSNVYQSLHITVIGPNGTPVELQIRTPAMHRTAEHGPAPQHVDDLAWLRQVLDWQRTASEPSGLLDALRFDRSGRKVYVFTPMGDVVTLPTGSTPVDFAYAVHTQVGHRCVGARVNGDPVPLDTALSNGDIIEIETSGSSDAAPSPDWLGFVRSGRAHTKIRRYLNKRIT